MSQLHVFDLWLCRYVRRNVAEMLKLPYFQSTHERIPDKLNRHLDVQAEYLRYDELSKPQKTKFPDPIRVAEANGKQPPLLLNDHEFELLEQFTDVPITDSKRWVHDWESSPPEHHERAINCIREIANGVSQYDADRWASDSRSFAERLERDGLTVNGGVQVIRQWVTSIRKYLAVMGRSDLLPRPEGRYPTPTTLAIQSSGGNVNPPPPGVTEGDVSRVRTIIEEMGDDGKSAKPAVIIAKAAMNNQKCRRILRWLELEGDYEGFRASKSDKPAT